MSPFKFQLIVLIGSVAGVTAVAFKYPGQHQYYQANLYQESIPTALHRDAPPRLLRDPLQAHLHEHDMTRLNRRQRSVVPQAEGHHDGPRALFRIKQQPPSKTFASAVEALKFEVAETKADGSTWPLLQQENEDRDQEAFEAAENGLERALNAAATTAPVAAAVVTAAAPAAPAAVTTAAPVAPTAAPVAAAAVTTAAPAAPAAVTTAAPVVPTAAPVAAPALPTAAPVAPAAVTTAAPVAPTAAPVLPSAVITAAPAAPVAVTAAPAAPVAVTAAPAAPVAVTTPPAAAAPAAAATVAAAPVAAAPAAPAPAAAAPVAAAAAGGAPKAAASTAVTEKDNTGTIILVFLLMGTIIALTALLIRWRARAAAARGMGASGSETGNRASVYRARDRQSMSKSLIQEKGEAVVSEDSQQESAATASSSLPAASSPGLARASYRDRRSVHAGAKSPSGQSSQSLSGGAASPSISTPNVLGGLSEGSNPTASQAAAKPEGMGRQSTYLEKRSMRQSTAANKSSADSAETEL